MARRNHEQEQIQQGHVLSPDNLFAKESKGGQKKLAGPADEWIRGLANNVLAIDDWSAHAELVGQDILQKTTRVNKPELKSYLVMFQICSQREKTARELANKLGKVDRDPALSAARENILKVTGPALQHFLQESAPFAGIDQDNLDGTVFDDSDLDLYGSGRSKEDTSQARLDQARERATQVADLFAAILRTVTEQYKQHYLEQEQAGVTDESFRRLVVLRMAKDLFGVEEQQLRELIRVWDQKRLDEAVTELEAVPGRDPLTLEQWLEHTNIDEQLIQLESVLGDTFARWRDLTDQNELRKRSAKDYSANLTLDTVFPQQLGRLSEEKRDELLEELEEIPVDLGEEVESGDFNAQFESFILTVLDVQETVPDAAEKMQAAIEALDSIFVTSTEEVTERIPTPGRKFWQLWKPQVMETRQTVYHREIDMRKLANVYVEMYRLLGDGYATANNIAKLAHHLTTLQGGGEVKDLGFIDPLVMHIDAVSSAVESDLKPILALAEDLGEDITLPVDGSELVASVLQAMKKRQNKGTVEAEINRFNAEALRKADEELKQAIASLGGQPNQGNQSGGNQQRPEGSGGRNKKRRRRSGGNQSGNPNQPR